MPALDDDRHIQVFPLKRQRPAIHEDEHDGLPGMHQHLEQLPLPARQRDVRARGRLSGHGDKPAQDRDDHVAVIARGDHFVHGNVALRTAAGEILKIREGLLHAV